MRRPTSDTESSHQRAEGRKMSRKSGNKKGLRARVGRVAAVTAAAFACLGIGATGASAAELSRVEMAYSQAESTSPLRQAGGHPDITTTFAQKETSPGVVSELMHQFEIDLPPGVLANAAKFPTCPAAMLKAGPNGNNAVCPIESQIGGVQLTGILPIPLPLYNVVPPKGAPALFAANVLGTVVAIKPTVRPSPQGYGITMDSGSISQSLAFSEVIVKFWGYPLNRVTTCSGWNMSMAGCHFSIPARKC